MYANIGRYGLTMRQVYKGNPNASMQDTFFSYSAGGKRGNGITHYPKRPIREILDQTTKGV